MAEPVRTRSPFLVAAVAWLVPGAGYLLIGQRTRGLTIGITILVLIILGILIGGVRVYDVPGYGRYGYLSRGPVADPKNDRVGAKNPPRITEAFVAEVFNKPWYPLQALSGAPAIVLSRISITVARPDAATPDAESVHRSHAAVWEMGVLYTAIAGMLNLLAMIDSAYRACHRPAAVPQQEESQPSRSLPVPPPPSSPQREAAA